MLLSRDELQHWLPSLLQASHSSVLCSETCDVFYYYMASIIWTIWRWKLGCRKGVSDNKLLSLVISSIIGLPEFDLSFVYTFQIPLHYTHLQFLYLAGSLCLVLILFRDQRSIETIRPSPKVLYCQVGHLSILLARYVEVFNWANFSNIGSLLDNNKRRLQQK